MWLFFDALSGISKFKKFVAWCKEIGFLPRPGQKLCMKSNVLNMLFFSCRASLQESRVQQSEAKTNSAKRAWHAEKK